MEQQQKLRGNDPPQQSEATRETNVSRGQIVYLLVLFIELNCAGSVHYTSDNTLLM